MPNERPSLDEQAARWKSLNESYAAEDLRQLMRGAVQTARELGLRIEVRQVSHACSMGATHEEIIVTPSREGYQSTT